MQFQTEYPIVYSPGWEVMKQLFLLSSDVNGHGVFFKKQDKLVSLGLQPEEKGTKHNVY